MSEFTRELFALLEAPGPLFLLLRIHLWSSSAFCKEEDEANTLSGSEDSVNVDV